MEEYERHVIRGIDEITNALGELEYASKKNLTNENLPEILDMLKEGRYEIEVAIEEIEREIGE